MFYEASSTAPERLWRRILLAALLVIEALTKFSGTAAAQDSLSSESQGELVKTIHEHARDSIPALYRQLETFDRAIAVAGEISKPVDGVQAVVAPHHLLAADVIATVLGYVAQRELRRIVLLSPDSFRRAPGGYHVASLPIQTVFGTSSPDLEGAAELKAAPAPISLFRDEHGLHAILPFLVKRFPGVPTLPVIIGANADEEAVGRLEHGLRELTGPDTLIVLSGDFSHYLPLEQAVARDQETLNILAAGDPAALVALREPDNLDNRVGLQIVMKLQRERGSEPLVIDNRNSQSYVATRALETTSYISALFRPPEPTERSSADLCLAGDLFLGRGLARYVNSDVRLKGLAALVRENLPNCPLIINLESVLTRAEVVGAPELTLWADAARTLQFLREIGVVGVNVANNHAHDLGLDAYNEMVSMLSDDGLLVLEHGRPQRVGGATLVALTEFTRRDGRLARADLSLEGLGQGGLRPPIIALPHWGVEWNAEPGERQIALSNRLLARGVSGIFGAHPHVASRELVVRSDGRQISLYSMGNLLFDQLSPPGSGKIVLLDIFDQGTFFVRQLEVDGFYSILEGK